MVLAIILCVAPCVNAAGWTTLYPVDYISDVYYEGGIRYVLYEFDRNTYIRSLVGSSTGVAMDEVRVNLGDYNKVRFNAYPLGVSSSSGPPLSVGGSGGIAIDVSDFRSSAILSILTCINLKLGVQNWFYDTHVSEYFDVTASWSFAGYRASGDYIGTVKSHSMNYSSYIQDNGGDEAYLSIPVSLDFSFSGFSEEVKYIVPSCEVVFTVTEDNSDIYIVYVEFSLDSFSFTTRTDMLLQESLTLQEIKDQIGDTNNKLDELLKQPEAEKQQASDIGIDGVDEFTGVVPDVSQGFMSAIQELAASMSYEGTEAKLQIPAIDIPAIPGLFGKHRLLDEQEVDFSFFVQKMPEPILTLAQVVLTIALIVYAFKELYSIISYAMTLKSGGGD